jgi:putative SOS response-associated peptidase YedK
MVRRVAFFSSKEEIESYFNIKTKKESYFEPHYNLAPGQQLPVLSGVDGSAEIERMRWGKLKKDRTVNTEVREEDLPALLQEQKLQKCILPLSGFYIWKKDQEESHPFFVRLLNSPIMSIAGICHDSDPDYVSIVTTEANPLIQPMNDRMPLFMRQRSALQWFEPEVDIDELLKQSKNQFNLTDLSVLKVSKKVNDPTNNSPDLIQPIPK